jgi:hypothetical protein
MENCSAKIKITFFLVFSSAICCLVKISRAATIYAPSRSYDDVSIAVSAPNSGDTAPVPA